MKKTRKPFLILLALLLCIGMIPTPCRLADITNIPVSVREMDDDLAILVMVDANMHREKILPSEKAYSYKMRVEALKRRRASEPGLVVSETGYRRPTEIVGEEAGETTGMSCAIFA